MTTTSKPGGAASPAPSTTRLYLLQAVGPVHIGVGEGLGDINLPTARETATDYPYVPGSSLKGVLRDLATVRKLDDKQVRSAFGPPTENADDGRGGLVFSDASLLALPVRSLFGTLAYVTCPFALRRLARDATEAGAALAEQVKPLKGSLDKEGKALVSKAGALVEDKAATVHNVFLEELELKGVTVSPALHALAQELGKLVFPGDPEAQAFLEERLLLVPDDLFSFYCRNGLEVRSRVRIDPKTGTAAKSGPWLEEHIPAETLLHGLVLSRTTVYKDRTGEKTDQARAQGAKPAPDPKAAEVTEPKAEDIDADYGLTVLKATLKDSALLRLGGKASVGIGRARLTVVQP